MDKLRFLTSEKYGSAIMRGEQMAAMMQHVGYDSVCVHLNGENHRDIAETICIVVKTCEPAIIEDLIKQNNTIIYDVVDKFSRKEAPHQTMGVAFADGVIVTHKVVADYFQPLFASAKVAVIPHQYDPRFEVRTAEQKFEGYPYKFRLAYFGAPFNHHFKEIADVLPIYDTKAGFEYGGLFTCHFNAREPGGIDAMFKPATKVSTAAACGANIITTKEPSIIEMLGEDYPYYIEEWSMKSVGDVIKRAYSEFDKEQWWNARDMMKKVKLRTSIDRVAKDYIDFLVEFGLDRKEIPDMKDKKPKSVDFSTKRVSV